MLQRGYKEVVRRLKVIVSATYHVRLVVVYLG
jgi:hypothetical protein